jgi:hypothetical protein
MKRILLSILMVASLLPLWSQVSRLDSLMDDLLSDEKEISKLMYPVPKFQFLYAGVNYNSKTFYAGREIGDQMSNTSYQLYYFHSFGFFAGVSGSWYSQIDPSYKNTVLSAGFSKTINMAKSIYLRASYSRYFYYQPDPDYEYNFSNNLSTGLTFRKSWIGARVSLNFLFGQDFGMNMSSSLFSKIRLIHLGKYDNIQLEPELSFYIASETTVLDNSLYNNSSRDIPTNSLKDSYGLLNSQLYIPITISLRNLEVELGYSVNIPRSLDENTAYPVSSFFSFSIGYLLQLN